MKNSFALLLILICINISTNAQYPCSGKLPPSIRGPLTFDCGSVNGIPFSYHIPANYYDPSATFSWSLTDPTCGQILSNPLPTINSVQVKWTNPNGNPGLIYTNGDCSDTIYMQCQCESPPAGYTIITPDLDDLNSTNLNQLLIDFNATIGPNNTIFVSGGDFFIQGQLDMENYNLVFNNCRLKMGSGAVLYGRNYVFTNCFIEEGCGSMWQGVKVPDHFGVQMEGGWLADAEYGIEIYRSEMLLYLAATEFKRNFISIYSPPTTYSRENSFSYYVNPSSPQGSSSIKNVLFNGTDDILANPYHGQSGIPEDNKPFAGMYFNNLRLPQSPNIPPDSLTIPFNTDPGTVTLFNGLNYGIFASNSHIVVRNANFIDCRPVNGYTGSNYNGTGIFARNSDYTRRLSVGGIDDPSFLRKNIFSGCKWGICFQNVNTTISYNDFDNSAYLSSSPNEFENDIEGQSSNNPVDIHHNNFTFYNGGIEITNSKTMNLNISNNVFFGRNLSNPADPYLTYSNFFSSGIKLFPGHLSPTTMYATIHHNTFSDSRIGIYINGISGSPGVEDFSISDNEFSCSQANLELFTEPHEHFGIWLDNCRWLLAGLNYFDHTDDPYVTGMDIQQKLRAFNVKSCKEVVLLGNKMIKQGTGIRTVSNCNGTDLLCNVMDHCQTGVYCDLAQMTAQGSPTLSWDNQWIQPNPVTEYRIEGIASGFGIPWYFQGVGCGNTLGSTCSNNFSPEPFNNAIVFSFPGSPSGDCGKWLDEFRNKDVNKLARIVGDSINYSTYVDQSRYLDKLFAYNVLKENDSLKNSNPDFINFFLTEAMGNIGKFDEIYTDISNEDLSVALSKNGLIISQNLVESNYKFLLNLILQRELNGYEFSSTDMLNIEDVANQTAWEGGEAVFIARAMLKLEVDDQEHHLRIGRPHGQIINNQIDFNIFPNPSMGNITVSGIFCADDCLEVIDLSGRILQQVKPIEGIAHFNLPKGSYFVKWIGLSGSISVKKLVIL